MPVWKEPDPPAGHPGTECLHFGGSGVLLQSADRVSPSSSHGESEQDRVADQWTVHQALWLTSASENYRFFPCEAVNPNTRGGFLMEAVASISFTQWNVVKCCPHAPLCKMWLNQVSLFLNGFRRYYFIAFRRIWFSGWDWRNAFVICGPHPCDLI